MPTSNFYTAMKLQLKETDTSNFRGLNALRHWKDIF